MKNIYSILIVTVLLTACGSGNKKSVEDIIASQDLEQIRAKKASLDEKQQVIIAELKQLESEIKKLDPQQKIPLITTFKAEEEVFNHFVELQGNVTTKQNVVINAEYGGLLSQVYVKEGQQVRKGQTLAKIDDGGLGQQLT